MGSLPIPSTQAAKFFGQCKSFADYNYSTDPKTGFPRSQECLSVGFDMYSRTPEVTSSWGNFFAFESVQQKFHDFWSVVAKAFVGVPVNPSTPGAPADPVLQQGMSPSSTFVIEGESQGPDYGRTTLESLRTPLTEPGMRGAAQLPIGAVTATTVDGGAGTLGQSAVQSVEAAVAADDVQPCQLPRGHGTMVVEPSVRREDTGPVATMANFSGPGRDETLQGDRDNYQGCSLAFTTGRLLTEDCGGHLVDYPWDDQDHHQRQEQPQQAEVARQLEAAMGEMQDRLRKERERSDEAVKEAQAL
ncbi:hypothetical protein AK812_SmicGene45589, partial [Symbiodinium microadriaticum]